MTKPAQVAIVIMRWTIRVLARERAELLCACPDLCFVLHQDTDGLLLRAGDIRLYHQKMVLIKRGKSYVSVTNKRPFDLPPSNSMAGASHYV